MRKSSKISNKSEKTKTKLFEEKIISRSIIMESVMQFLNKEDMLCLIDANKDIKARVANSDVFRKSSMYSDYMDYLNDLFACCFNRSVNKKWSVVVKTLSDIINDVCDFDLKTFNRLSSDKKPEEQKKFYFNPDTEMINSFFQLYLRTHMLSMALVDILSITKRDFYNVSTRGFTKWEEIVTDMMKNKSERRVEKIFDIVPNNSRLETKTFWDKLKIISNEKYCALQAELKNQSRNARDVIYSLLFSKYTDVFAISEIRKEISKVENKTIETIKKNIKDEGDALEKNQQALAVNENKLKILRDGLRSCKEEYDHAEKEKFLPTSIKLDCPESVEYRRAMCKLGFETQKNNLEKEILEVEKACNNLKNNIEVSKKNILELKKNLETREVLDEMPNLISDVNNIGSENLKNLKSCCFDFLLNYPDEISSFHFDFLDSDSVYDFAYYLLEHKQHKYFYLAIIEISHRINEKIRSITSKSTRDEISKFFLSKSVRLIAQHQHQNPNMNLDFIENILIKSRDSSCSFYEDQIAWLSDQEISENARSTIMTIIVLILVLIEFVYTGVWFIAQLYGASWIFSELARLALVIPLPFFLMILFPSILWLSIPLCYEKICRKRRRVIYDNAREQLRECKKRSETYREKLTNQKKIFDKYLKVNQESPNQEQIEEIEEKITT